MELGNVQPIKKDFKKVFKWLYPNPIPIPRFYSINNKQDNSYFFVNAHITWTVHVPKTVANAWTYREGREGAGKLFKIQIF